MTTGKILLGVLAGVAVGATLGILFAPDKGSETRKKISKKGADLSSDVSEKLNDFIADMSGKFEKMKKEVNSAKENHVPKSEEAFKKA